MILSVILSFFIGAPPKLPPPEVFLWSGWSTDPNPTALCHLYETPLTTRTGIIIEESDILHYACWYQGNAMHLNFERRMFVSE